MAAGDIFNVSGSLSPNKEFVWKLPGGASDTYVEVDAFTAARVAANDTTGTFTAWIMMDGVLRLRNQTVIGNGDADVVEFLDIGIEAGLFTVRCTDATVVQFVTQADAIHFQPYTWYHIAVVQAADGYGPKLYVDGVKIAATNDTATDVDEWYANLDGMDSGLFGASNKSGDDSITNEFAGFITDVKYWDSALTADQVKKDCEGNNSGVTPTTYWPSNNFLIPENVTYIGTPITGIDCIASGGNPFACMLNFLPGCLGGPVVADDVSITTENGIGYGIIVKAA